MRRDELFLISVVFLFIVLIAGVYAQNESETSEKPGNFFAKIANFFKNLFNKNLDTESSQGTQEQSCKNKNFQRISRLC